MNENLFQGLPLLGELALKRNDHNVLDTWQRNIEIFGKCANEDKHQAYNLVENSENNNEVNFAINNNFSFEITNYLNYKFSKYVFNIFSLLNIFKILYLCSIGNTEILLSKIFKEAKNPDQIIDDLITALDIVNQNNFMTYNFLISKDLVNEKPFSKFNKILRILNFNKNILHKINSYIITKSHHKINNILFDISTNTNGIDVISACYLNIVLPLSTNSNFLIGVDMICNYYEDNNIKLIEIPCSNYRSLVFDVVMIKQHFAVDMNDINKIISEELSKKKISIIKIPVFKVESNINCNNMLRNLHVDNIFQILELNIVNNTSHINNILQKCIIEVGGNNNNNNKLHKTNGISFICNNFMYYVRDIKTNMFIISGKFL